MSSLAEQKNYLSPEAQKFFHAAVAGSAFTRALKIDPDDPLYPFRKALAAGTIGTLEFEKIERRVWTDEEPYVTDPEVAERVQLFLAYESGQPTSQCYQDTWANSLLASQDPNAKAVGNQADYTQSQHYNSKVRTLENMLRTHWVALQAQTIGQLEYGHTIEQYRPWIGL